MEDDVLGSLTGFTLLLICMAAVSFTACLCICICVCCKCMKIPDKAGSSKSVERVTCYIAHDGQPQQPIPPGFYPPTPPKDSLLKKSLNTIERSPLKQ